MYTVYAQCMWDIYVLLFCLLLLCAQASGLESSWTSPAARTTARWAESDTSAAHPNTVCSLLHHGFKGESSCPDPEHDWLGLGLGEGMGVGIGLGLGPG